MLVQKYSGTTPTHLITLFVTSYNYTVISYNMHIKYKLHTIKYIICHCVIIAVQQNTKSDFDVSIASASGGCAPRPPAFEASFPFNLASVKLNSWLRP